MENESYSDHVAQIRANLYSPQGMFEYVTPRWCDFIGPIREYVVAHAPDLDQFLKDKVKHPKWANPPSSTKKALDCAPWDLVFYTTWGGSFCRFLTEKDLLDISGGRMQGPITDSLAITVGPPCRVSGTVPVISLADFRWCKFQPLLRLAPTGRRGSSLLGRRVFVGTNGYVIDRLGPKASPVDYSVRPVGTVVAGTSSDTLIQVDVSKSRPSKKGLQRSRGKRKPPELRPIRPWLGVLE